jgi:hypothetical protein
MTPRERLLAAIARYVFACLLAIGLSVRAQAQEQVPDTTRASARVKDLPLTAAQRQAFVGSYAVTLPFGEPTSLRIFEENGVLKAQPEGQQTVRLLYQGDNIFRPEGIPNFVLTFVVEPGRATTFTVPKEDGLMKGVRIP